MAMIIKKDKVPKKEKLCILQYSEKCKNKNGVRKEDEFYATTSSLYKDKRCHICKDCIKEYVYNGDTLPDVERFKHVLRMIDVPFNTKFWEQALEDKSETIGIYLKNVKFKLDGQSYSDDSVRTTITEDDEEGKIKTQYDYLKLRKKWGKFSDEDLEFLEERYMEWDKEVGGLDTLSSKKMVKRICVKELQTRIADERGESTEKLDESLIKLMNTAQLTPKSLSEKNKVSDEECFGIWNEEIEKYEPSEYFKDKKIYEDSDNLWELFKELLVRPMKNLLLGQRDFTGKYSIEEEDELGEVNEDIANLMHEYGIDNLEEEVEKSGESDGKE